MTQDEREQERETDATKWMIKKTYATAFIILKVHQEPLSGTILASY